MKILFGFIAIIILWGWATNATNSSSNKVITGKIINNKYSCTIQPIKGEVIETEPYYYCPLNHLVRVTLKKSGEATDLTGFSRTNYEIEDLEVLLK